MSTQTMTPVDKFMQKYGMQGVSQLKSKFLITHKLETKVT